MTNDLISKYRPETFDAVRGQDTVVASLRKVLKDGTARSFLFTGPSGTGKTTLGRIIAREVGCDPSNLMEIDAATFSGVDDMRGVTGKLAFRGMSGSAVKVVIIDECHALSKTAWQSILKALEEPPAHVWWILATTESDKVPETIRTRCARYDLHPVSPEDLYDLIAEVAKAESYKTPDEVLATIARRSQGSPRRALSGLAACAGCTTKAEALALLKEVDTDDGDVINLARMLLKGRPRWEDITAELKKIDDRNPESIRIVICAYMSKVALGASGSAAERPLEILSAFEKPYPQQSGMASVLLSFGRLVFTE